MIIRLITLLLIAYASSLSAQILPSSRTPIVNWQSAGMLAEGGIPNRTTICQTIDANTYGNGITDATAAITAAIANAACTTGTVVYIPAGTYNVTTEIQVNKSITIRGDGAGRTIIKKPNGSRRDRYPTSPNGDPSNGIFFAGTKFPSFSNSGVIALTVDGAKGATTVSVAAGHGITAGMYLELSEDQFFAGGQFVVLPLNDIGAGVPTLFDIWRSDKIFWSMYRQPPGAATITNSNSTTDIITSAADHTFTTFDVNREVYLSGHSGTFSPNAANGIYVIESVPSTTTLTLKQIGTGTHIDVTASGTGGTYYANLPFTDFGTGPQGPTGNALTWFNRGGGHVFNEVKEVASTTSTSITFTTPLTDSYRVSHSAELAFPNTTFITGVGFEDMTLWQASNMALSFRAAAKSWAKGIEVLEWGGHGIEALMSHKIEIFGSVIRDAAWPVPGGGGYAFVMSNGSSEILLWNSLIRNANKCMVSNAGGAGSVIAYNFCNDSMIWYSLEWVEAGINGSHFSGSHGTLFEGNLTHNLESENSHGTSYQHTFLRNWVTGRRDSFDNDGFQQNTRTISFSEGTLNMSYVGNLSLKPGFTSGWVYDAGTNWFLDDDKVVWKMGYNPGQLKQHADTLYAIPSVIREGNFDYLTNTVQWSGGAQTIPDSYFLLTKPSFFGSCPWPWIDTVSSGAKFNILPVKIRYDAGQVFNLVKDPCSWPKSIQRP